MNENRLAEADLRLVRDARAGNGAAVERFVERMRCIPRILAAKNARLGNPLSPDDLADAAQHVFSTVWSKADEYKGEALLETWVYPFCTLTLMNAIRQRTRRPLGIADAGESIAERTEPRTFVEDLDAGHVHEALARLGPEEATVVRLKQFEERTFEEIAELMGIPVNTAKSRYYRGLESLREKLRSFASEETS